MLQLNNKPEQHHQMAAIPISENLLRRRLGHCGHRTAATIAKKTVEYPHKRLQEHMSPSGNFDGQECNMLGLTDSEKDEGKELEWWF